MLQSLLKYVSSSDASPPYILTGKPPVISFPRNKNPLQSLATSQPTHQIPRNSPPIEPCTYATTSLPRSPSCLHPDEHNRHLLPHRYCHQQNNPPSSYHRKPTPNHASNSEAYLQQVNLTRLTIMKTAKAENASP